MDFLIVIYSSLIIILPRIEQYSWPQENKLVTQSQRRRNKRLRIVPRVFKLIFPEGISSFESHEYHEEQWRQNLEPPMLCISPEEKSFEGTGIFSRIIVMYFGQQSQDIAHDHQEQRYKSNNSPYLHSGGGLVHQFQQGEDGYSHEEDNKVDPRNDVGDCALLTAVQEQVLVHEEEYRPHKTPAKVDCLDGQFKWQREYAQEGQVDEHAGEDCKVGHAVGRGAGLPAREQRRRADRQVQCADQDDGVVDVEQDPHEGFAAPQGQQHQHAHGHQHQREGSAGIAIGVHRQGAPGAHSEVTMERRAGAEHDVQKPQGSERNRH